MFNMASTIAQLESNRKFEKLLDLFQQIAPNNQAVQKEISTLTNSKANYIKNLQAKWNAIQPPRFTELEIRELNTAYFDTLESTNEERTLQGLPRVAMVDSKNWIVKTEGNWFGWDPENSRYYIKPLLYEGSINFQKIFEPLVISDRELNSINLIWTIDKILVQGEKMGLSPSGWINVWLTLAKSHLPNDFQSLSRYSSEGDKLFMQLTASINSENEISKLRSALGKITRKPNEMFLRDDTFN